MMIRLSETHSVTETLIEPSGTHMEPPETLRDIKGHSETLKKPSGTLMQPSGMMIIKIRKVLVLVLVRKYILCLVNLASQHQELPKPGGDPVPERHIRRAEKEEGLDLQYSSSRIAG